MKKIIFVAQSLRIGGAQRALLNQLNDLSNNNDYEVSLFLYSPSGEYLEMLNKDIKIIKSRLLLHSIGITYNESKKNIFTYIVRNTIASLAKLLGSDIIFNFIFRFSPKLKDYDAAVSYLHNIDNHSLYFGYNKFVLNNIKANKKIAWIHSDYEVANLNTEYNNEEYNNMDYVINVSKAMKKTFDKFKIISESKSRVMYNILPADEIRKNSLENISYLDVNTFNIITINRMDNNKSVLELCQVAKVLVENNQKFIWHFIGDGPLYNKCRQFITENDLERYVFLHGFLSNPYSILKDANLFVSGSKSETFGMSIAESLILNVPVIALKYPAIGELIDNNGIVVNDFDEMSIKIGKMIDDKNYYNSIKLKTRPLIDYNLQNRREFENILSDY
ncbi:MAG: hypothetical protein PWR27_1131 [Petroclostridium sp.]|nr:hypothetical protein [Petroclostridium sp.]